MPPTLAAEKRNNTTWQVYPLPSALADGYKAVLSQGALAPK